MPKHASNAPVNVKVLNSKRNVLTVPNAITLVRLLLIPLYLYVILWQGNNLAAFLIFVLAAVSDFFDGLIARATGQISAFGKVFDPLVDRAFILACAVSLLLLGRIPLWVLLIFVVRDGIMLAVSGVTVLGKHQEFKVNMLGKIATALLMVAFASLIVVWPVMPLNIGEWHDSTFILGYAALYLGLFFYIVATLKYFIDLIRMLRSRKRFKR